MKKEIEELKRRIEQMEVDREIERAAWGRKEEEWRRKCGEMDDKVVKL